MTEGLRACAGGADRFAVVDTETTGVYSTDRVVEVAIVTLSLNGDVLDRFDTLVNPCRDIGATSIHGITASMVRDAPTFEEIAGDVAVRLHGACFVAHNAPFDTRMILNEFQRAGGTAEIPRAVDTYVGSGSRLAVACTAHRIALDGHHCAAHDAEAASQLFARLGSRCGVGAPIGLDRAPSRSSRVCRRSDLGPVELPDTPLIAYLASRLPFEGLPVVAQEYLEFVGRAVADLHLDRRERAELVALAASVGLSPAQMTLAHRRYVHELVDAAVADDVVTDDEYSTLVQVAAALGVDQADVERRVMSFRTREAAAVLTAGQHIVFTGDHPTYARAQLEERAITLGLVAKSGVSRKTGVVCAVDVNSASGKAAKARQYGIPVVTVEQFMHASLGDVLGAAKSIEALKVIICPECHATSTVPATAGTRVVRRCDTCSRSDTSAPSLAH